MNDNKLLFNMNTASIEIENINSGWIDITIKNGYYYFENEYSFLTDFFGDLLESIYMVMSKIKKYVIFDVEFEPGIDYWFIKYDSEKIYLKIFTNASGKITEEGNIDGDCDFIYSFNLFPIDVIDIIDKNLDNYGSFFINGGLTIGNRSMDDLKELIKKIKIIIETR